MVSIVAVILALLIAPAAAALLQPRVQNVPAGGTACFLPATPDELGPSGVSGSDELSEYYGEYATQNIAYANAGFESQIFPSTARSSNGHRFPRSSHADSNCR